MDDACAEGIADEHYRLEGRLWLLHWPRQNIHFIAKIHHDLTFVPLAVCLWLNEGFLLPPSHLRSSSFLSVRGYTIMKSPVT